MPEVSSDGCTVTVKIKKGVKFSPPVNREVQAKDVKYAIERGFFNSVNNGYAGAYYGDIKGAKVGVKPGTEIPGIETPDKYTRRVQPDAEGGGKCTGGALAGSMVLPLTAPVPKEYAAKYDAKTTSTYGAVPGRDRPVHDREQRRRQGDRLRGGQAHPPRAQPELVAGHRLAPGVRRRDQRSSRATTTRR